MLHISIPLTAEDFSETEEGHAHCQRFTGPYPKPCQPIRLQEQAAPFSNEAIIRLLPHPERADSLVQNGEGNWQGKGPNKSEVISARLAIGPL